MLRVLLIIGCCVALAPRVTVADDPTIDGRAAKIASDTWAIVGLESGFELTPSGLNGEVRMAQITLLASDRSFDDVRVGCTGIVLTTHGVTCDDATFTATIPGLGRKSMRGGFEWNRLISTARVALRDVAIAGGRVSFEILASDAGIEASYSGSSLRLDELMALAARFTHALAGYSGSGQVALEGSFAAPADGPMRVAVSMDLEAASLANDAGTVAAADVTGRLDLDVAVNPDATRFDLVFDSDEGEAYLEPVYSNFSEHALHLRADGVSAADLSSVRIDRFELRQDTLLDASGSASVVLPSDEEAPASVSADVRLRDSSVAALYTSFVQVQLAGTLLGALDTGGRVSGTVQLVDNALRSAALELDDVIFDDRAGRFAVYGLDGAVNWTGDAGVIPPSSRLSWDSGTVYSLIVGAGDVELQLGDNDIELLQPARLPFAGGALRINQLALQGYGDVGATGRLDAELEPVQLGQLTGAFGWPAFSGELSGRLPLLQLAEDEVTVGGDLDAQFFDGTMTMSNLRIERPFGRVPRLYADVSIRNLDLERVTEAFSFGYIQGRLSGDVTGLKLENWRPVAMDLYFYTPPDDSSPHRISQRAVENLASVGGGGAAAVLSTGFLRFFEVFSYDRIGLRCRLANGVCAMSGAGAAKPGPLGTGYYIVKGRGLPRIDVVGYRDKVSWPRLVQQLSAITRSGAPTVD